MNSAGKEFDINLKCGMHNGRVYFGLIETPHRKQITVIGEEVNLASRLVEEIALNEEIIASSEVKNMVNEKFVSENINVTDRLMGNKIKNYEEIDIVFRIISERN
jgi:class 3 adenylate cyclase